MSVEVESMVKSQTITWMDEFKELCKVEVTDGDYIDPDAIEVKHILERQTEFNIFIKAIRKAMKDTEP